MSFAQYVMLKMSDRNQFAEYPEATRKFYNHLIYISMINLVAVQRGLFDTVFCDIQDEVRCLDSMLRFYNRLPVLRVQLGLSDE